VRMRHGLGVAAMWLAAAPCASAAQAPDDPLFSYQWNLAQLQIPAAWEISRGAGATVAVLDTGVAYEDRGRYRRAPDLAAARLTAGRDFVDGDAHPDDVPPRDGRRSHGTLIAALTAATAANGLGTAGVAPAARVMAIRVLEPDLAGSAKAIARGLRYAADHGADIANLSLAGPRGTRVLRDAVAYATSKGVTIVAAAGNDGRGSVSWPAAYPQVIAVGATTRERTRASYSNYGSALDLVAPAGAGERTDTGYGPSDGVVGQTLKGEPSQFCICSMASTSAAAAQVSGVAALLIASGRARGPAQVRAALVAGARDLGAPGRDRVYGAGLVRARSSLDAALPASARRQADAPHEPQPSRSRGPWLALALAAVLACLVAIAVARRRRRAASG
jgi:serine protease